MITRWLGGDGAFRVIAVDVTALVEETVACHAVPEPLQPVLAHATVVHALLSAHIKGEEQVALHLTMDAPRVSYMGQLNATGRYRAYLRGEADSAVDPGCLHGMFLAIKSLEGKELYRSASVCEGESLEAALRRHMNESNQADIWLRVAERWGGGEAPFAGGVLIERFPEAEDQPSLTEGQFETYTEGLEGAPAVPLVEEALAGTIASASLEPLGPTPLVWQCICTRDRAEGVLCTLGAEDLRALAEEQGEAEVACHFCGSSRTVTGARMLALADQLTDNDVH